MLKRCRWTLPGGTARHWLWLHGRGVALVSSAAAGCDLVLTGRDQRRSTRSWRDPRRAASRSLLRSICAPTMRPPGRAAGAARVRGQTSSSMPAPPSAAIALTDADWQGRLRAEVLRAWACARGPAAEGAQRLLVTMGGTSGRKGKRASPSAACERRPRGLQQGWPTSAREDGVRVNCIHPSLVETERHGGASGPRWSALASPKRRSASARAARPGSRFGTVEDVADLIASWSRRAPPGCTMRPSISTAAIPVL
jgi:NAD(P)-dependent dehydrogenase (short-subunit alcohol dehydrogenase family)